MFQIFLYQLKFNCFTKCLNANNLNMKGKTARWSMALATSAPVLTFYKCVFFCSFLRNMNNDSNQKSASVSPLVVPPSSSYLHNKSISHFPVWVTVAFSEIIWILHGEHWASTHASKCDIYELFPTSRCPLISKPVENCFLLRVKPSLKVRR